MNTNDVLNKLIAEIERRLNIVEPHKDTFESAAACRQELIWMKDFIASLQQEQPKVDLEKETIIDYVHNRYHYDKDFDGYGHSNLRPVFTREDLTELASHFYSLGLNARKK